MELFLNVLWLLLAVPAVWAWRREPASTKGVIRLGSARRMMVLSCALMLLFPVISATDDLHAMRPEMEESSSSKRIVQTQLGSVKASRQIEWRGSMAGAGGLFRRFLYFDDQNCAAVMSSAIVLADYSWRECCKRRPRSSFLPQLDHSPSIDP